MQPLYQRIKDRREALGLTQDDLAQKLGYKTRSSIAKIEKGLVDIPQSKILAFAQALDTTPAYLMGWDESSPTPQFDNVFPVKKQKIPLLGEIACGKPIFADEDRESYIAADADLRADFCLKAKGDSMINARILDGDIVFIRRQPMVDNGEIAAVRIGDEATLKRVYYYPDAGKLILTPENPAHEPLVYIGEELNQIEILGKAIAFQSDVR